MSFQNISSLIEPSFWYELNKVKLNDKMLDETPFDIISYFQAGRSAGVKAFAFINEDSFKPKKEVHDVHFLNVIGTFPITFYLTNTKPSFKKLDRNGIMASLKAEMINNINSGEWINNPSILLKSALTVFGDLKHWQYTYCFAFPNPKLDNIKIVSKEVTPEIEYLSQQTNYSNWIYVLGPENSLLPLTEAKSDSTFVLIDPSTNQDLGWPAKILSLAIARKFNTKTIKIARLSYDSALFTVNVEDFNLNDAPFTGWNLTPKKTAHFVDLSATMDPMQLFTAATSLNLRLMKWRLCPQLDVQKLQAQKCLLIGCGTLGCNVARYLLGWGVRKFVLIDYGKVSFSNPPRQSLFTFADCIDGGRSKCEAAAKELKRICPDVEAEYYEMPIPMPGHPLGKNEYEKTRKNVELLDKLIKECDCTWLLTDTRESRWLPTLLATANEKLCISVALGFDTFSVVRCGCHGLGCYFCNDVIAPTDTMTDRTLDMQCTVTRPGIAPMASSYGVELWASIVQTKEGVNAEADADSVLGTVPHQLRCFLHSWQLLPMAGKPFKNCVACSEPIIKKWKEEGWNFILRALTEVGYLEEVSGINAMKAEMADVDCEWEEIDEDQ